MGKLVKEFMMNEELYPELIDYIHFYCEQFKTPDEILAGHTISVPKAFMHGEGLEWHKRMGRYSDDPKIQAMIADGFENLKQELLLAYIIITRTS